MAKVLRMEIKIEELIDAIKRMKKKSGKSLSKIC
jgi:hypothetical protein